LNIEVEEVKISVLLDDYAGYETSFLAQHGLSIHVKVKLTNQNVFNILVDVGQQAEPIIYNAEKLGIELSDLDAILLTHCHYDHTGGLRGIIDRARKSVIIAHPLIFRKHYILKPKIRYVGIPLNASKIELEKLNVNLLLTREPVEIASGVYITGEVDRIDKPKLIEGLVYEENGRLIQDQMLDDISLIIKLKDKGVIITGCSHAGITNIVRCARKIIGLEKFIVIGGLHLISMENNEIEEIIDKLSSFGVEELYVGHCTGWKAIALMWRSKKFKEVQVLHSGKVMTIK